MPRTRLFSIGITLALFLAVFPAGNAYGAEKPTTSQVLRNAAPAVVLIKGYQETTRRGRSRVQRVTAGTGFFITADGYLLTNHHVVDDGNARYTVFNGTEEVRATVVYRDDSEDLALLKVSGTRHPVLAFAETFSLETGDRVLGMGNARGTKIDSTSRGRVTDLDADIVIEDDGERTRLNDLIETTARLYPGDSGGPLLNTAGQVVGVNTAIGTKGSTKTAYAVPLHTIREVLLRTNAGLGNL